MSNHDDLKAAMIAKGYTQQKLADELGISQAAVNQWANGKVGIPQARLEELEKIIGYVPSQGKGSDEWYGAMDDLGTFLRQGPVGFLVLAALPKDVEIPYPVPPDVLAWRIKTWAAHLSVTEGELVSQIAGRVPISARQVELVAAQGIKFQALAELVGNTAESLMVTAWFETVGPFESFKALRNAAAVKMLEGRVDQADFLETGWQKGAYDMDDLWAQHLDMA